MPAGKRTETGNGLQARNYSMKENTLSDYTARPADGVIQRENLLPDSRREKDVILRVLSGGM